MHTTTTPSSAPETSPQPEQQLLHKEELLQPTRKKSKDLAKFLGVDHPSQQQSRHRSCDLKKQKRNSALLDLQINGLIDFDEDYHPASPAHGDNVVLVVAVALGALIVDLGVVFKLDLQEVSDDGPVLRLERHLLAAS